MPQFWIAKPVPTGRREAGYEVYMTLGADAKRLVWGGEFPLPEIGDTVLGFMHVGLDVLPTGPLAVKGYFHDGAELGLMVLGTHPTPWLAAHMEEDRKNTRAPEWRRRGVWAIYGRDVYAMAKCGLPIHDVAELADIAAVAEEIDGERAREFSMLVRVKELGNFPARNTSVVYSTSRTGRVCEQIPAKRYDEFKAKLQAEGVTL